MKSNHHVEVDDILTRESSRMPSIIPIKLAVRYSGACEIQWNLGNSKYRGLKKIYFKYRDFELTRVIICAFC